MGATSAIEWTEATWSPLVGCTKVSPGCDRCYAETQVNTRFHPAALAKGGKHLEAFPTLFETVSIRPDRFLTLPLHWRKPRRIFVNSLSDLFHKDVPDEFIARVFAVMAAAPQHTFQLLTKRHGRMASLLTSPRWPELLTEAPEWPAAFRNGQPYGLDIDPERPLPNVWGGVSVEDQDRAALRIDPLRSTPLAVRWLSLEPLLGPVDLCTCYPGGTSPSTYEGPQEDCWLHGRNHVNWVVVGGESGPGARPMHPDWARSIRDQCVAAGVPYLFKQYGNWAPVQGEDDWRNCRETDHHVRTDGYHWPLSEPHGAENGTEVLMRNVGKKAAGRVLDGRTWDEYPVVGS